MDMMKWFRRLCLPMIFSVLLTVPVRAECIHEFVEMRQEPGCETGGMIWLECLLCGTTKGYQLLDPLGHTFDEWYVLEEPGCTKDGVQARDCVTCGFRETMPLAHLGHAYVVEVEPPTCTARGYTLHYCPGCGDRFRTDYTDPLGHRYDDGVITKEPTLTAMGRILYTCIGCGDTYQETIPMLTNPFVDVEEQAYYFTPVIWAVNNGITTGMDETHFVPDALCDRSQVATFLWRAAGKPEPDGEANPFLDVPQGSFYEKAVLWAYQSGITTGTDPTHFSPNQPCSRAQVVTFLHRTHGCPEPTVTSAFPDVSQKHYYFKAVLWAAERGITVGTDGGYFRPDDSCTRAQIVTFLYRDAKNP